MAGIESLAVIAGNLIASALIGSVLHELTHGTAVVLTGQKLHGLNLHHILSTTRATVRYDITGNHRARYIIGLAPAIVGTITGVIGYVIIGQLTGATGLALAVAWAFYTLNISIEDITGRPPVDRRESKAVEGLFLTGVGVTILVAVNYGPSLIIGYILWIAGLGLAGYNMARKILQKAQSVETTET